MKNFLIKFIKFNDVLKTKIILIPLILSNIIPFSFGETFKFHIVLISINFLILIPILIPIVFALPFTYNSKKGFFLYLYFFTNIYNLFFWILYMYNVLINLNRYFFAIPFIFGIFLAVNMAWINCSLPR